MANDMKKIGKFAIIYFSLIIYALLFGMFALLLIINFIPMKVCAQLRKLVICAMIGMKRLIRKVFPIPDSTKVKKKSLN